MSATDVASLINLQHCKEIINKFNQQTNNNNLLKVHSYKIVAATEVKGFLGEYFHLTIECLKHDHITELHDRVVKSNATSLDFFIKSLPLVDKYHEKVKIFKKESSLYELLLPTLQKYSAVIWCPNVYLCNSNVLVLQDLESQGFYSLAWKDDIKELEMLPILNGLAAMHASSLIYEFETKNNIAVLFSESLHEITVHPDIPWFATGLKAIYEIAKQHGTFSADKISELWIYLKRVFAMVNPSTKYRNVLCHRDTWGANIFLNRLNPTTPAIFVDFQTCRYCPPAIDIIFTLFMNLSKKELLAKQAKYIKYYYQQLVHHIMNRYSSDKFLNDIIFSEEEFSKSIEEFMLFGFVYRALALTVLKVPKELVTDYYKNEERSAVLLQYMKENKEFSQLMKQSTEDILEAVSEILIKENK